VNILSVANGLGDVDGSWRTSRVQERRRELQSKVLVDGSSGNLNYFWERLTSRVRRTTAGPSEGILVLSGLQIRVGSLSYFTVMNISDVYTASVHKRRDELHIGKVHPARYLWGSQHLSSRGAALLLKLSTRASTLLIFSSILVRQPLTALGSAPI
jgi:hypothetical protein